MPKIPGKPAVDPRKTVAIPREEFTSLQWVRDLFALHGKSKMLDAQVGQDALYIAVKMSHNDRKLFLQVLTTLRK